MSEREGEQVNQVLNLFVFIRNFCTAKDIFIYNQFKLSFSGLWPNNNIPSFTFLVDFSNKGSCCLTKPSQGQGDIFHLLQSDSCVCHKYQLDCLCFFRKQISIIPLKIKILIYLKSLLYGGHKVGEHNMALIFWFCT